MGGRSEHLQSERHLELGLVEAREHVASVRRSEVAGQVFAVIAIHKIILQVNFLLKFVLKVDRKS